MAVVSSSRTLSAILSGVEENGRSPVAVLAPAVVVDYPCSR